MPWALGSVDIGVQHAHPHRSWSLSSCPTLNPRIPEASRGTGNALCLGQEMQAPARAHNAPLQPRASPSPAPPATLSSSPVGPSGVSPVSRRLFLARSFSFVLTLVSPGTASAVASLPAPCARPHGLSSAAVSVHTQHGAYFAVVSPSGLNSAGAGTGREPVSAEPGTCQVLTQSRISE